MMLYFVIAAYSIAIFSFAYIHKYDVSFHQTECRRQTLLEHFGESVNRDVCKYGSSPCDNCLKILG